MAIHTNKTVIILLGATGVGKTAKAIELAQAFDTEIVSADSRQIYRDIPIGTAAPTTHEMMLIKHHLVGFLRLQDYYSAARFRADALTALSNIFQDKDTAIVCGGSMMYIDALCNGIDNLPTISAEIRSHYLNKLTNEGTEALCKELMLRDPECYISIDRRNTKRVVHALEVIETAGCTYTSLRKRHTEPLPFRVIKVGLQRPREELFSRINQRIEAMLASGWTDEAAKVIEARNENALNTVGYKELFRYLDGEWSLPFATERIKKNTRVYAKKQMTWWQRDNNICWLHPNQDLPPYIRGAAIEACN